MKKLIVPRNCFNLEKFLKIVDRFTLTMGGDESFPIVQDGVAVYDRDLCDMMDEVESEIPDGPVGRLESGHTLFCQFALCRDFDLLACAYGTEIEVPSSDEDDEEGTDLDEQDEEAQEVENETNCDENRSYGLLLSLVDGKLVIESGLMCDLSGDAEVEIIKNAGLVEEPMTKFINSFIVKPRRNKRSKRS